MRYLVERNARSGRFATVKITKAGTVVTSSGTSKAEVAEESLHRAKRAANTSLASIDGK